MGKGDKKSRRGKITMGSYGVSRPRKKSTSVVAVKSATPKVAKLTAAKTEKVAKKAAAPKKAAAKKTKKAE